MRYPVVTLVIFLLGVPVLAQRWFAEAPSEQETAAQLAINEKGVCRPQRCRRIRQNEPTPGWVIANHLEGPWLDGDEIFAMPDGRFGYSHTEGKYEWVPASICNRSAPARGN
jgi:hypothetical protein